MLIKKPNFNYFKEKKALIYEKQSWLDEKYHKIKIKEIPFMITRDYKVVCIPKLRDFPVIGISASRRVGKSVLLNSLLGRIYWYWNCNCCHINDSMFETMKWYMKNEDFNLEMFKFTGEEPRGLPKIHVFPNTSSVKIPAEIEENSIKMCIPFQFIIENIDNYYNFGDKAHYIKNLTKFLKEAETIEDVEEIIETSLPKELQSMKFKIIDVFRDIFRDEYLDIAIRKEKKEISTYLKIINNNKEEYAGHIFPVLMRANLVPILMTNDLLTKEYCFGYIAYILESIFNAQVDEIWMRNKGTFIFCDEMLTLSSTERKNATNQSLVHIAQRGGPIRMGMVYTTLNYNKIETKIKSNTKYILALNHTARADVIGIQKDFGVKKEFVDLILKLKKLECIAFTKEYFVTYDVNGLKEEVDTPLIGSILPPLNFHQPPATK